MEALCFLLLLSFSREKCPYHSCFFGQITIPFKVLWVCLWEDGMGNAVVSVAATGAKGLRQLRTVSCVVYFVWLMLCWSVLTIMEKCTSYRLSSAELVCCSQQTLKGVWDCCRWVYASLDLKAIFKIIILFSDSIRWGNCSQVRFHLGLNKWRSPLL